MLLYQSLSTLYDTISVRDTILARDWTRNLISTLSVHCDKISARDTVSENTAFYEHIANFDHHRMRYGLRPSKKPLSYSY